jgi:hypothetical protein
MLSSYLEYDDWYREERQKGWHEGMDFLFKKVWKPYKACMNWNNKSKREGIWSNAEVVAPIAFVFLLVC